MPDIAAKFRRAIVEAGWEIDVERLAAVLAGGGTILAAADVFAHVYGRVIGPMPARATAFAFAGVEVRKSRYLEPGQILAILQPR